MAEPLLQLCENLLNYCNDQVGVGDEVEKGEEEEREEEGEEDEVEGEEWVEVGGVAKWRKDVGEEGEDRW